MNNHESALGDALTDAYTAVVINMTREHRDLRPVFGDVLQSAEISSPERRETAVIQQRVKVAQLMDAMRKEPAVFRAYLDRAMRVALDLPDGGVSWPRWIRRFISGQLLTFLQGITIFAQRDEGMDIGTPPYHRASSCGPWDPSDPNASRAFERDHARCDVDDALTSAEELERRRRNVWTCLVERMAYDNMYGNFIGYQDIGHMHNELRVTRELFERCFAITQLYIRDVSLVIDAESGRPSSMRISYATPEYSITETYTRSSADGVYEMGVGVVGVRKEVRPNAGRGSRGGPGDVYTRMQSYLQEPGEWLPVSPGAPPLNLSRSGGGVGGGGWRPNCPGVPDPWRHTQSLAL